MSRTPETTIFTVEGSGSFPFDMLRYDRCWPYYSQDSSQMDHHNIGRRRVVLEGYNKPTDGRWRSFTWRVVEIGYPDENSRAVQR